MAQPTVEHADRGERRKAGERAHEVGHEQRRVDRKGHRQPRREQRQGQNIGQQEVALVDRGERQQRPAERAAHRQQPAREHPGRRQRHGERCQLDDRIEGAELGPAIGAAAALAQPAHDRQQLLGPQRSAAGIAARPANQQRPPGRQPVDHDPQKAAHEWGRQKHRHGLERHAATIAGSRPGSR
jgi:hypothetical protein